MRAVPKSKPEAQVERLFLLSLSGMHAKTVICISLTVSTVLSRDMKASEMSKHMPMNLHGMQRQGT